MSVLAHNHDSPDNLRWILRSLLVKNTGFSKGLVQQLAYSMLSVTINTNKKTKAHRQIMYIQTCDLLRLSTIVVFSEEYKSFSVIHQKLKDLLKI